MPDILKISGRCGSRIADVNGVVKGNIQDVNNVGGFVADFLPLDTYTGAAVAYSVRLLRTAYTGAAMRVRRDTAGGTGDDDEADIAFDSGVISLDSAISNASAGVTATTLGQFLNVGTVGGTTYTNPDSLSVTATCLVDEWKDQSGNANDAEQTTFGNQPQIHDGTVNTDLITENGKPAIEWDGSNDYLETTSSIFSGTTARSIFITGRDRSSTIDSTSGIISPDVVNVGSGENYTITSEIALRVTQFALFSDDFLSANLLLLTNIWASGNATDADFYLNGTALSVDSGNSTVDLDTRDVNLLIGKTGYDNATTSLTASELIFWNTDQSSNRTNIECNINGYFKIY